MFPRVHLNELLEILRSNDNELKLLQSETFVVTQKSSAIQWDEISELFSVEKIFESGAN